MRFLVDECLSTRVSTLLRQAGHDALHVVECGLAGAPDEDVLAQAFTENRVLLSADTDFGGILARSGDHVPSVVLFRRSDRSATALVSALMANFDIVAGDLDSGAFAVITDNRLRIRSLPIT